MKVLVIDDNETMQRLYGRMITQAGHTLIVGGDGSQAVPLAVQETPDAIILDVMMPTVNGLQALGELKANETTRSIPVIMLSANEDGSLMQQCLQLGASRYFVKGMLEPQEVIQTLEAVIAEAHPTEGHT